MPVDQLERFAISCNGRSWQSPNQLEEFFAIMDIAARELSDNERVCQHGLTPQCFYQGRLTLSQVMDPHRRVYKNHDRAGLRLGIAFSPGSVPPSFASRLALSREMRARRPS